MGRLVRCRTSPRACVPKHSESKSSSASESTRQWRIWWRWNLCLENSCSRDFSNLCKRTMSLGLGNLEMVVGTVVSLWRYPVKSMMGEELNASAITEHGLFGDRAYAIMDRATGKVASAKH